MKSARRIWVLIELCAVGLSFQSTDKSRENSSRPFALLDATTSSPCPHKKHRLRSTVVGITADVVDKDWSRNCSVRLPDLVSTGTIVRAKKDSVTNIDQNLRISAHSPGIDVFYKNCAAAVPLLLLNSVP